MVLKVLRVFGEYQRMRLGLIVEMDRDQLDSMGQYCLSVVSMEGVDVL